MRRSQSRHPTELRKVEPGRRGTRAASGWAGWLARPRAGVWARPRDFGSPRPGLPKGDVLRLRVWDVRVDATPQILTWKEPPGRADISYLGIIQDGGIRGVGEELGEPRLPTGRDTHSQRLRAWKVEAVPGVE